MFWNQSMRICPNWPESICPLEPCGKYTSSTLDGAQLTMSESRRRAESQFLCKFCYGSPPARWGLLDFMSVASCVLLLRPPPPASCVLRPAFCLPPASSSSSPRPPRPTATCDPQRCLPDLNHDHPRPMFPAGPLPRASPPSVPCRTSTTTIHAQCSLPDLNHDHPRPVFPAGPQPRPSTPSGHIECQKICQIEC